jgi:hypothetical protein
MLSPKATCQSYAWANLLKIDLEEPAKNSTECAAPWNKQIFEFKTDFQNSYMTTLELGSGQATHEL